jgi:hypothetical protein
MKFQLIYTILFLNSSFAQAAPRFGDSTSAFAIQTIVQKLQIRKVSDLNFGDASPGDGEKTIIAGPIDTRENASFEVEGEPLRPFQIVLPAKNSVKMISGPGGVNREILIQEFNSFPPRVGILNTNGNSPVYVGATRSAISSNQKTGEYIGQFYITVVY